MSFKQCVDDHSVNDRGDLDGYSPSVELCLVRKGLCLNYTD